MSPNLPKPLFQFNEIRPGGLGAEKAELILRPYSETLAACCIQGLRDYHAWISPEGQVRQSSAAAAFDINCFLVERVREAIRGWDGVEADDECGFFKVYVGEEIALRFKKVNRKLLAANVETNQQRDWYNNCPINGIRNECMRLTLGYRVSFDRSMIETTVVTHQYSRENLAWHFPIELHEETYRFEEFQSQPALPPEIPIFVRRPNIATGTE